MLYLDPAYFGILLDADVLLDILVEDLILANIATMQGLLFQSDRVDRSVALLNTTLWELRREQLLFQLAPRWL